MDRGPARSAVQIHYDRISGGLNSHPCALAHSSSGSATRARFATLPTSSVRNKRRPAKDRAVLPILRDTLMVKKKLDA